MTKRLFRALNGAYRIKDKLQMRYLILLLLVNIYTVASAEWAPPQTPDPDKILDEARQDACDGKYQDALIKHLWFHNNALKYDRALYGVRLSFALSDWQKLGKEYPPALQSLRDVRDKSGQDVKDGKNYYDSFHDYVAMNESLAEEEKTIQLFRWLDTHNKEWAKRVYRIAQSALIKEHEYKLCGKYIDPDNAYLRYVQQFNYMVDFAKEAPPKYGANQFAYKNFSNSVSTLVALLVLSDRKPEAEEIAEMAMLEWDDKGFALELSDALKGNVPKPWP
jgi:hypothetical protein